ncbi:MAG TPA: GNAT family N-acetyltransferase [Dyadobacter sp.]|nr:GNAT family N-acetyltransferase [Dyadobacter sp.]
MIKNKISELKTDRLLLRKFCEKDIDVVYRGLSDKEVIKYYGVQYDSLAAAQEQMGWFSLIEEQETGIWWAVCDLQTLDFLGAIGFNNWSKKNRTIEIGYWLLPEYWGKGVITEAGEKVCAYAFESMSVHRIEAVVETENQSSRRVMSALHFTYEGTKKDCEIKDGKFLSLEMYAKLNRE